MDHDRVSRKYSGVAPTTYKEGSDDGRKGLLNLNNSFQPAKWYLKNPGDDHISLDKIREIEEKAEMRRAYILSRVVPYGSRDYNPD